MKKDKELLFYFFAHFPFISSIVSPRKEKAAQGHLPLGARGCQNDNKKGGGGEEEKKNRKTDVIF